MAGEDTGWNLISSMLEGMDRRIGLTTDAMDRMRETYQRDQSGLRESNDAHFKSIEIAISEQGRQTGALVIQVNRQNGNVATLQERFDKHMLEHDAARISAAQAEGARAGAATAALTKGQWRWIVGALSFVGLVAGTAGAVIAVVVQVAS